MLQSSATRNLHICRSIYYQFFSGTSFWHGTEHSSRPYSIKETVWYVTQTVQHDQPESYFGARNCDNLRQIFRASFW